MAKKNETLILGLSLLVSFLLVGGGGWWLWRQIQGGSLQSTQSGLSVSPDLATRFSDGSRILVTSPNNEKKQLAIQAAVASNSIKAINLYSEYLQQNRNDPEALIYLNNLKALENNPLRIAVVAPVSGNLNIAQEILRGVAQAQEEINRQGGIKGRYLHITLVDDSNDSNLAPKVAQALVANPEILGVIGHNASSATLSAAPTYQAGKLVLVNPTSLANGVGDVGDYIFRVVPTISTAARSLSEIARAKTPTVAVCYDSQAPDAVSFEQEFMANFLKNGGQLAPTVCDLSNKTLVPKTAIQEALASGAKGLLLLPHIERLQNAYDLAKANQGQLKLYGNSTLATIKTLEQGQNTVGLILAVPWSAKNKTSLGFAKAARQQWGGDVSWRTAGAYDATYVLAQGLGQNPSRTGLQQALGNPQFVAPSINGEVHFLPNGERSGPATLVEMKPAPGHITGYDFTLIAHP
ncbi:ABC transporter substrate-binding protein [Synechocystis sp. LKSZ1]|uniref:ABC transporter substrate-binding protein n=1 Tax=Synechocystis sp. LKSZ1 TaxID=3144951 RepID=UPI00336BD9F0